MLATQRVECGSRQYHDTPEPALRDYKPVASSQVRAPSGRGVDPGLVTTGVEGAQAEVDILVQGQLRTRILQPPARTSLG